MQKTSFTKFTLAAGLISAVFGCGACAQTADFESAKDAVVNMGLGWSIGNSLDAYSQKNFDMTSDNFWGQEGLESETVWGQPVIKKELVLMMKEAGFGTIRIPVTWFNHMDANGKVSAKWMARVHEVVDYVIDAGLYCILNVHHDTGADSDSHASWIKADEANYTQNKARYEYLWKQIAEEFKDYDQHLLFEGYNEMLDKLSSWCYASFAASGQYNATVAASAYNAINSYAQSFVTTVRATGGNNAKRNLIVNTYAACSGHGTWKSYLKDPLKNLALPKDDATGHIAFEIHDYPSIEGSMSDVKAGIDDVFAAWNTNLIAKGAPVILGEWGTANVDAAQTDYDLRRDAMFEFVDYIIAKCKALNICPIYWGGLSSGVHRSIPAFHQPDLAERLAKAWHGSSFAGTYPTMGNIESITLFEGTKDMEWGNAITLDASIFSEANKDKMIEITYKQNFTDYDDIQFYTGDWSTMVTVVADDKSYVGDFSPATHYGTPTGTAHVTAFTISASSYSLISQTGLVIQGHGVQVTKVALVSTASSSLPSPIYAMPDNQTIYDLSGRKVANQTRPGIYISGGKKYLVN